MTFFPFIRPLLHALPAEQTHTLGLWALKHSLLPAAHILPDPMLRQDVFGLSFVHPVGLAAGFDKNAEVITPLHRQGFSFVEAGTVTPLAQDGNPKPRMFRLPEDRAVINRLGFNNHGLAYFTKYFAERKPSGIAGANIGKNKNSEDAVADYIACLQAVYPLADYVTINISSPNTQGLRTLQKREQLSQLLGALLACRTKLSATHGRLVPLLVKIAPDLNSDELEDIAEIAIALKLDGLIISNTTIKRPRTLQSKLHGEQGGLSGAPLLGISTDTLSQMYRLTKGSIPLVGVGGVQSAEDAYAKIRAGASLVQIYTAIVYQGFGVVHGIVRDLPDLLKRDGFTHVQEAVGANHR